MNENSRKRLRDDVDIGNAGGEKRRRIDNISFNQEEFDSAFEKSENESINQPTIESNNIQETVKEVEMEIVSKKDRLNLAIENINQKSLMYPKKQNCNCYSKVLNPMRKRFVADTLKATNEKKVKRKIIDIKIDDRKLTFKSVVLTIKESLIISDILALCKLFADNFSEKKIKNMVLKTRRLKIPISRSFLFFKFIDLIFKYYKTKNNYEKMPEDDEFFNHPTEELEKQSQIKKGLFLIEEHLKSNKKKNEKLKEKSNEKLKFHVCILMVSGERDFGTIYALMNTFSNIVNDVSDRPSKYKLVTGKSLNIINIVSQVRFPSLINYDANIMKTTIRLNKDKFKASKVTATYEPNKFPAIRIKLKKLGLVDNDININLQIFQSGFVQITGFKTSYRLYEYYKEIVHFLYSVCINKEDFLKDLENSKDLNIENSSFDAYDENDKIIKLEEEWKKEKFQFCNQKVNENEKKGLTFRKSMLNIKKQKFVDRYFDNYTLHIENIMNLTGREKFSMERNMEIMNLSNFCDFMRVFGIISLIFFVI
jgi:TATA-box binding protein (TBP) (component of TFIID and TFIIIB)/ribosomal protein L25 (general stress protein Ctc)